MRMQTVIHFTVISHSKQIEEDKYSNDTDK